MVHSLDEASSPSMYAVIVDLKCNFEKKTFQHSVSPSLVIPGGAVHHRVERGAEVPPGHELQLVLHLDTVALAGGRLVAARLQVKDAVAVDEGWNFGTKHTNSRFFEKSFF